ncbi:hypothetical protein [Virgibacillus sp. JSM 102003]|uniref:hypothetical protein n=1 Tax=Virgibacillus sp. JSM 102003 TaxID=1562108 RepID=UPI0035C05D43
MNNPSVLIISNSLDFTTDYVCVELEARKIPYLRLNRDEFDKYNIRLEVKDTSLFVNIKDRDYWITERDLISIYYRAPIYLRDIYQTNIETEEQLYRTQWTSFIRNLSIFEDVRWLNNPTSTFKAENKILQLKYAQLIGFDYPDTTVLNSTYGVQLVDNKKYIVKSLDTAVLKIEDNEAFVYSMALFGREIKESNLRSSPVILQEYIEPKVDIRVTVIKKEIYAVKILKENKGIKGDWRLHKYSLSYIPIEIPFDIANKCREILEKFDLAFGAIDLAKSGDKYYFIEVNPTGEWAWLVDNANQLIFKSICDYLERVD